VVAHEGGHTFGLDHPPDGGPEFTTNLMGSGWYNFPDVRLNRDQISRLRQGGYFTAGLRRAERRAGRIQPGPRRAAPPARAGVSTPPARGNAEPPRHRTFY
jgi:hypothetical protein